jgi:hypothetical protein
MATYKGIQGYTVQKLATDPTVEDSVGQLWYNSTTYNFKIATSTTGAWAAGGTLVNPRYRGGGGGIGTVSAAMIVGGYSTGTGSYLNQVEQYDGTAWTEGPMANYPASIGDVGQCGITTASIAAGGNTPSFPGATVFVGNGSVWTSATAYPAAHSRIGMAGTQTAALGLGGDGPPNNETWAYNGTGWTAGGAYTHAGSNIGISGVQTAAIGFDGYDPGADGTEAATYDGSTWTAITATSTARGEFGWSTKGPTTDTMAFGTGNTEKWNGSSWSELANNATPRSSGFSVGTTSLAFYAGGNPGGITATEEWADPVYAIKTVTVS